jgi:hypothetical protein
MHLRTEIGNTIEHRVRHMRIFSAQIEAASSK